VQTARKSPPDLAKEDSSSVFPSFFEQHGFRPSFSRAAFSILLSQFQFSSTVRLECFFSGQTSFLAGIDRAYSISSVLLQFAICQKLKMLSSLMDDWS